MSKDTRSSADVRSIRLRVPQHVNGLIERAAVRSGMNVRAFILDAVNRAAEQALDPSRTTFLKPDAFAALLEALARPPKVNEQLRAAFERHKHVIASEGIDEVGEPTHRWRNLFATAEIRTRLTPAAIRAFTRLATLWNLTDVEAETLAGLQDSGWTRANAGLWKGVC